MQILQDILDFIITIIATIFCIVMGLLPYAIFLLFILLIVGECNGS